MSTHVSGITPTRIKGLDLRAFQAALRNYHVQHKVSLDSISSYLGWTPGYLSKIARGRAASMPRDRYVKVADFMTTAERDGILPNLRTGYSRNPNQNFLPEVSLPATRMDLGDDVLQTEAPQAWDDVLASVEPTPQADPISLNNGYWEMTAVRTQPQEITRAAFVDTLAEAEQAFHKDHPASEWRLTEARWMPVTPA